MALARGMLHGLAFADCNAFLDSTNRVAAFLHEACCLLRVQLQFVGFGWLPQTFRQRRLQHIAQHFAQFRPIGLQATPLLASPAYAVAMVIGAM